MKKIRKEMDNAFHEFFDKPKLLALPTMGKQLSGFKQPLGEIVVKKNAVVAKLEMPGIDKKDVVLNIGSNFIEVKAEKNEETTEEKKDFLKQERSYKGFYRRLPLPMPVKPELAESHFSNGILEITMPKAALPEKKQLPKH
ncbi:MAG: Hsp20/alpha crystallin family protein [Nanoarchaeota archaeon]|nr:Hsp20/alpha crystallin family protein [Nanoarchaeota archaeon]